MSRFWKVHGLGNDFVLFDALRGGDLIPAPRAVELCDRHTGIGADGVLTLLPGRAAPFFMHLFNADGSEARMCGNGIRCLARHIVEAGHHPGPAVPIETGAGVRLCRMERRAGGEVWVTVDMGPARFERAAVPMAGDGEFVGGSIRAGEREFTATALSMGNPHLVIFGSADEALAARFGPLLERHPDFPDRVNVGFAEVDGPRRVRLRVWERGCGLTRACGTGACAAAAAGVRLGRLEAARPIEVLLPGGPLEVTVPGPGGSLLMAGPTAVVFTGRLE